MQSSFPLGTRDVSNTLQFGHKLYGRAAETERLVQAFAEVHKGASTVAAVSGPPGMGKSTLIDALRAPVIEHHGFFATGKHDQFQKNLPFAALLSALQDIVAQALSANEVQVGAWRSALLAALGSKSGSFVELVPEAHLMLGETPVVPKLGPVERNIRLGLAVRGVIKCFATREHPRVIFLDDIQWADRATLALLTASAGDADVRHLLLPRCLPRHGGGGGSPAGDLALRPAQGCVAFAGVPHWAAAEPRCRGAVADAMRCGTSEVADVASALSLKSDGNPFFLRQLLQSLYEAQAIRLDPATGKWTCDNSVGTSPQASLETIAKYWRFTQRSMPPLLDFFVVEEAHARTLLGSGGEKLYDAAYLEGLSTPQLTTPYFLACARSMQLACLFCNGATPAPLRLAAKGILNAGFLRHCEAVSTAA